MKEKKINKVFMEGAIPPSFIADSIAGHSSKKEIGAHSIFLGQVRNDIINEKEVQAIEYSAYIEMAEEKFHEIRETAFNNYSLTCMHIYHSIGKVNSGEISLFVFTSSKHRKDAIDACTAIVERIKKEVPVWGKEIFEGGNYAWKMNN
jgi:molybdopterin synthase catalytic subunit